jgi:hypothetical protein
MRFDPSIAAQESFRRAQKTGELGEDLDTARQAEETFSSNTGEDAKAAYETLQRLGERHPTGRAFQEFLIYITWQQAAEETIPVHFQNGLKRCERYLQRWPHGDEIQCRRIEELRASFRAGLGLDEEDDDEYDKDTFKGGD